MSDSEALDHAYRCVCGEGMHIDGFHAGRLVRCPRCGSFVIVPRTSGEQAVVPCLEIGTERLRIDPVSKADWKDMHAIYGAPENYRFEVSLPTSERQTRSMLRAASYPRGLRKSSQLTFRVVETAVARVIGSVTLEFTLPYYAVNLGFMVHHEHHGRGYGTEAVGAVVDWLFDDLHAHKVSAMCDSRNAPCKALLERVGFVREGELKDFLHHPERGWLDSPMYALFRERRSRVRAGLEE